MTDATQTITVNQAIAEALAEEMRRDPRVRDVRRRRRDQAARSRDRVRRRARPQHAARRGDHRRHRGRRRGDRPASGHRPAVRAVHDATRWTQIVNSAGKLRYISGGQFSLSDGRHGDDRLRLDRRRASTTTTSKRWFVHAPGLKVVMPSTRGRFQGPAQGRDPRRQPGAVLHGHGRSATRPGEVPDGEHVVPLGKAARPAAGHRRDDRVVRQDGAHCLQAAEHARREGHLGRGDRPAIAQAARRGDDPRLGAQDRPGRSSCTKRAGMCGVGAEVAAIVAEHAFSSLKAPVVRVTGPDAPPPSSYALEQAFMPQPDRIVAAAESLMMAVV